MKTLRHLLACTLALACVFFSMPASAQNLVAVPPLAARVTDLASMLNADQVATLEKQLADYETRTGSQIAILLLNSTEPETIEQYSIRVADAWKLGRKGVDDGVILLVAKENSAASGRLRIETGRGVQGVLTDAQSKRVLQDVIAPRFQQNDFYGGLAAGVSVITALLDKEAFPEPTQGGQAQSNDDFSWSPFILFAILIVITMLRSRGGGRGHSRDDWGNSAGVILGSAIGHELGRRSSGGGFGGFGGGGFGGGGGFSGGGGGFDGGGASGNW